MKRRDELTLPGKPWLLNHIHAEIINGKCVTVLKSWDPRRHGWKHLSGAQRVAMSENLTDGGPYRAEDLLAILKSSYGHWWAGCRYHILAEVGMWGGIIQQPINKEIRRCWCAGGRGQLGEANLSFFLVSCGSVTAAECEVIVSCWWRKVKGNDVTLLIFWLRYVLM